MNSKGKKVEGTLTAVMPDGAVAIVGWPPVACRCGRFVSFCVNRDGITLCVECDTLEQAKGAPMSLDDLEKRAVLKPVEAELDRQKEKCARMKKSRNSAKTALKKIEDILGRLAPEHMRPLVLRSVQEALDVVSEEQKKQEELE